jgi:hypothetical protein
MSDLSQSTSEFCLETYQYILTPPPVFQDQPTLSVPTATAEDIDDLRFEGAAAKTCIEMQHFVRQNYLSAQDVFAENVQQWRQQRREECWMMDEEEVVATDNFLDSFLKDYDDLQPEEPAVIEKPMPAQKITAKEGLEGLESYLQTRNNATTSNVVQQSSASSSSSTSFLASSAETSSSSSSWSASEESSSDEDEPSGAFKRRKLTKTPAVEKKHRNHLAPTGLTIDSPGTVKLILQIEADQLQRDNQFFDSLIQLHDATSHSKAKAPPAADIFISVDKFILCLSQLMQMSTEMHNCTKRVLYFPIVRIAIARSVRNFLKDPTAIDLYKVANNFEPWNESLQLSNCTRKKISDFILASSSYMAKRARFHPYYLHWTRQNFESFVSLWRLNIGLDKL